jgi:hypothetical protein
MNIQDNKNLERELSIIFLICITFQNGGDYSNNVILDENKIRSAARRRIG